MSRKGTRRSFVNIVLAENFTISDSYVPYHDLTHKSNCSGSSSSSSNGDPGFHGNRQPRAAPRSPEGCRCTHTFAVYQMINTPPRGRETRMVLRRTCDSCREHARMHVNCHPRTAGIGRVERLRETRTALPTGSCHSRIARENVAARSGIANHGETETAGETGEGEEGRGRGRGRERRRSRRSESVRRRKGEKGEKRKKERGRERETERDSVEHAYTLGGTAMAAAATYGPCSVADGGAKRLSDFVVDPDSSLRRLSLPGFPLLPRAAFRLSRAGRATPRTCLRTETRLFIPTTRFPPLERRAIPTTRQ